MGQEPDAWPPVVKKPPCWWTIMNLDRRMYDYNPTPQLLFGAQSTMYVANEWKRIPQLLKCSLLLLRMM